jgi:hypothetical protein
MAGYDPVASEADLEPKGMTACAINPRLLAIIRGLLF